MILSRQLLLLLYLFTLARQQRLAKEVAKMKLAIDDYLKEAFKRNGSAKTHKEVHKRGVEFIKRCYAENIFIVFTDGLRTNIEQAVLFGKGRAHYEYQGKQYGDPSSRVVTKAKPGSSFHNYGFALDFVMCDGYGKSIDYVVGAKWKRAAQIAKDLGFIWGGDWKTPYDPPHIQYNGGLTLSQVAKGMVPTFKPFTPIQLDSINTNKEELTLTQYTELKTVIDAQAKVIAALQKEVVSLRAEKADITNQKLGAAFDDSWKWAKDNGLLDGTNPGGALTRQQLSLVLKRFDNKFVSAKK